MFRIDHEVSKWCLALRRQGRLSGSQLEELRDHVYDEVEKQKASGVSEEEAFRLAINRLGTIDELTYEYSKNQRIGHLLSVIAHVPYGAQILGIYLMALACIMSYSTATAYFAYYSGQFTPPDTVPLMLAFIVITCFGWCGFKGFQLLRGNALGYGALVGLLALILVQVPIFGGPASSGYEFSGGLQLAALFGPVEQYVEFDPVAEVHINTGIAASYFGVNIVALLAGIFIGSNLFDRWRRDRGAVAHAATPE